MNDYTFTIIYGADDIDKAHDIAKVMLNACLDQVNGVWNGAKMYDVRKYDGELQMSKKDFELIAYLLSVAKANDTMIELFAITLKQHYPNFDRQKFKEECVKVQYRSATMEGRNG